MAVTMKQIAEMAGVSIGTVDRALNKRGRISPEVAERICKIAETLDYRPNAVAKSLAIRNKNLSIGIIIHVAKNEFYADVIAGVEKAASEMKDFGISVIIRYGMNFNHETQLKLIDELIDEGINALGIVPVNHPKIAARLDALHQSGFPVVFIAASLENTGHLAYIGCNYRKTGEIAAGLFHMISGGHGNVLFISPNYRMLEHRLRAEGLRDQLTRQYPGLKLLETAEMSNDHLHNYQLAKEALCRNPDADYIFCGSSSSIIQAIHEYSDQRETPLKVISFDFSQAVRRAMEEGLILAAITQDPQGQGYHATMILFHHLTGQQLPQQKNCFMEQQILIRESLPSHDHPTQAYRI